MHPCKTCYDDIPDLQGVNIVRCYFTNSQSCFMANYKLLFKDYSQQAAVQSQFFFTLTFNFLVVYLYIHNQF